MVSSLRFWSTDRVPEGETRVMRRSPRAVCVVRTWTPTCSQVSERSTLNRTVAADEVTRAV